MTQFTIDENEKWKVTRLVDEYNHELVKFEKKYLLRSEGHL